MSRCSRVCGCTAWSAATATADSLGSFIVPWTGPASATTAFQLRATDPAGNPQAADTAVDLVALAGQPDGVISTSFVITDEDGNVSAAIVGDTIELDRTFTDASSDFPGPGSEPRVRSR